MRLFDFGRNYAKNYASIICQGLMASGHIHVHVCHSMRVEACQYMYMYLLYSVVKEAVTPEKIIHCCTFT